jgi:hypothetical protein
MTEDLTAQLDAREQDQRPGEQDGSMPDTEPTEVDEHGFSP